MCQQEFDCSVREEGNKMFSFEVLKSLNDLEMLVYHYVMEHKMEVKYMTIRELADAVHVSTSTILRFCKKTGCDGYSEFRVKFKMYLKEEQEKKPTEDLDEIMNFFRSVNNPENEAAVAAVAGVIQKARQLIFIGIGTSGILGKYGARYFSNLGKFSQHIEDPYYPIGADMEDTVVIALSVSGEKPEVVRLAERFKHHNCELVSITNKSTSTLARMSDYNLTYYVSERLVKNEYSITTQVPVVYLLETLGRRLL